MSSNNFRSYTVEADFEGIKIPLPNIYRYITRDKNGFINAWQNRPTLDNIDGCYFAAEERPITLGHDSASMGKDPAIRKYRRKRSNCIISVFGIIPQR